MKIELKSVVFSERLSEETNCFTANIYVDGKKVGSCKNNGCGGSTDYYFDNRVKLEEVEKHCKSLPEVKFGKSSYPNSLENTIDELFEAWLSKKTDAKFLKDCDKGICYGSRNSYTLVSWGKVGLAELLKTEKYREMVRLKVVTLVANGEKILNTNLPEQWLKGKV